MLGIQCSPKTDTISVKFEGCRNENELPTKGHILSALAKLYDPIGFISPVIFHAKLILQEAWEKNLLWDEHLPADLASKWKTWCREMERAKRFTIPRCYVKEVTSKYTLHGYCDASTKGYAAVIYLHAELYEGVCCRHIPTGRVVQ